VSVEKLNELKDVLLKAREAPDYCVGSPRAIDHLLMHVVYLIDIMVDGRKTPKDAE